MLKTIMVSSSALNPIFLILPTQTEDLKDTFRHKGLRKNLVKLLKEKGITDINVLNAIEKVPRHLFVNDTAFLEKAYEDIPFPIGEGQTISQPHTVALQSQMLNVSKGLKILEVGTGSGYQASILMEMGAKVYTIERQKSLYTKTKLFLLELGYKPKAFLGDGSKGMETFAPYDRIIVTAGAPYVPNKLVNQLCLGGSLVIPVGNEKTQKMLVITRISETETIKKEYGGFAFVPLIGEEGW